MLREGLWPRRERALQTLRENGQADADFLRAAVETIDAVTAFCDRWADALHQSGQAEAGKGLRLAVRCGAQSFRDALQLFRLLHFCLWASNVYHNTVGRFDQYMLPFLQADLACGLLDEDAAQDLLEEFFLSFNRDSDLYQGMQQGDNGQSLMLGGCDADGACAVNQLTAMCLKASLHLGQIDPKINLRVDKNTPLSLYELGAQLTRQGLGFPQYANDDVVIPGLVRLGYALEDARTTPWPPAGSSSSPAWPMDIPNIAAMPLAGVVGRCIRRCLAGCQRFEDLLQDVREAIFQKADELLAPLSPLFLEPAPFQSVLMDGCLERGQDISKGAKYNNYGVHGTGFSQAVTSCWRSRRWCSRRSCPGAPAPRHGRPPLRTMRSCSTRCATRRPSLAGDEEALPLADELSATSPTACAAGPTSGVVASGPARARPCTTYGTPTSWARWPTAACPASRWRPTSPPPWPSRTRDPFRCFGPSPAQGAGHHQRRPADAGAARHRLPRRGRAHQGGHAGQGLHSTWAATSFS